MYQTSSNFNILYFRSGTLVWILIVVFCLSFVPSVSFAQQPTATIKTLSGNVLVSGQAANVGTILNAGDTIQTQAGASVALELSDGSEIHLGENTQVNIADLTQTITGERISRLTLLRGWLRAFLSPGHQKEGSSFRVDTPNAQVGVKFSQPDVEVSYDPEKQETIGIAHTVELLAKNLLTDEEVLVPVSSSVIIAGMIMKVVAGTSAAAIAAGAETAAAETTTGATAGMGTGTMIAVGVGAAAAAGGVVAVAAGSGDGNGNNVLFTGTFIRDNYSPDGSYDRDIYILVQDESTVTGTFEVPIHIWRTPGQDSPVCTSSLSPISFIGTVDGNTLLFSLPFKSECCCDWCCTWVKGGDYYAFIDNDNALVVGVIQNDSPCGNGCGSYFRQ